MGRPREFDMDQALSSAMSAFWDHGYEATSVSDLMEAMDLQKGSIYKAFGDKHGLYIASLQHYLEQAYQSDRAALQNPDDPKEAIRKWLMNDVVPCCKQSFKRGCLMINAISELSHKDKDVEEITKDHLNKLTLLLKEAIQKGQSLGNIRRDVKASEIAKLIIVNLIGMITLTKCNTSQNEHKKNITNLLMLLD